jgi:hypothetical protein
MTVRADHKQIGLHLGWNKRKSGLGGVQVTYLKVNWVRPNGPWAGPGKIIKFQPVPTFTTAFSEHPVRDLLGLAYDIDF